MEYILAVEDGIIVMQKFFRGLTKRLRFLRIRAERLEVSSLCVSIGVSLTLLCSGCQAFTVHGASSTRLESGRGTAQAAKRRVGAAVE
jgi:hypothetical protein